MMRYLALLAMCFILSGAAHAGTFRTESPQEATVRAIATKLRCPVCQSENILESRSGTAREMLEILREQLAQGRSEVQIIDFFRDRYGDYVMLSPPTSGLGGLVWIAPLFLLLAGGGAYLLLLRRSRRAAAQLVQSAPEREPLTESRLEELNP